MRENVYNDELLISQHFIRPYQDFYVGLRLGYHVSLRHIYDFII